MIHTNSISDNAQNCKVSANSVRLVWLVAFAIFVLLTWTAFAKIDVVARGIGQVVPSQRVQYIQNLEGGILQELFVHEGDEVEQGALLARIENQAAGSQYQEALTRSVDHQASIARLQALIHEKAPAYPPEVLAQPAIVERHNNILQATTMQEEASYRVLQLQADAQVKQAAELEAKKKELQASLKIAQRQRTLAAVALRQQAYSEIDFLGLEQSVQKITTELSTLEHSIPRLYVEAEEMQERIKQHRAEELLKYNKELGEIQTELISLQELLKAGSDKVLRTELRAPVRGIVKRIYQNTVGGVVSPGATLMDLVPSDDSLIIEAKFSPADIGFLSVGLDAIVRLSAYDFVTYGSVDAKVENISADTLEDEQGQIFYIVKVRTSENVLKNQGRELPIIAGMQAEVDVVTGKKSILDYILKPFLRVGNRAFREQ